MDLVALAASIDQTLLKPTVGAQEAGAWARDNRELGFASLCVTPSMVPAVSAVLAGSSTLTCSVAGFPFGHSLTTSKVAEAIDLVAAGCAEVDMVANIPALLESDDTLVADDIAAIVRAVDTEGGGNAIVKVILETGHLDEEQIRRGCRLAVSAGAAFVKTSTGFGPRGASVRDVELMREAVGPDVGVKAAGGIRDLDAALALLTAGADRLGTSAGAEILAQARARGL